MDLLIYCMIVEPIQKLHLKHFYWTAAGITNLKYTVYGIKVKA